MENRRPPRGKQKANKLPSKVCDVANDDRERAKHALEMNNLKEANKIAKAGQYSYNYSACVVYKNLKLKLM